MKILMSTQNVQKKELDYYVFCCSTYNDDDNIMNSIWIFKETESLEENFRNSSKQKLTHDFFESRVLSWIFLFCVYWITIFFPSHNSQLNMCLRCRASLTNGLGERIKHMQKQKKRSRKSVKEKWETSKSKKKKCWTEKKTFQRATKFFLNFFFFFSTLNFIVRLQLSLIFVLLQCGSSFVGFDVVQLFNFNWSSFHCVLCASTGWNMWVKWNLQ